MVVQVVSEVLCLARNPSVVKRLADEKEEIFVSLVKDRKPGSAPGVMQLLETLSKHDVRRLYTDVHACVPGTLMMIFKVVFVDLYCSGG